MPQTSYHILDVREPYEFESCHVEGAVNIPMQQLSHALPAYFNALPDDAKILIMCRIGRRAEVAADYIDEEDLWDMNQVTVYRGGMVRWEAEGKPLLQPKED